MEIAAAFLVPTAAWYLFLSMDRLVENRLERFFLAFLIGSFFGLLLLIAAQFS